MPIHLRLKELPRTDNTEGKTAAKEGFCWAQGHAKAPPKSSITRMGKDAGLLAERVGLDSATNPSSALVMSLCLPSSVSPLCRQDYCFCMSDGVSLGHDKRAQFLLQQTPLPSSKPALPFANAFIFNSAANEKVFPQLILAHGSWQVPDTEQARPHARSSICTHAPLARGI